MCLLDIKILGVRCISCLYACLLRKCCILLRGDATHQSSTTTSSTHPTAHQADDAHVMLVPCAARTLTKTSRLQLSLRVLNFSISRPRSNMKPMIEPIGWLRTLQFVAIDVCVREDECVCAPLLFLYNVLNSEYKCMWVAST